jgi:hypothetical protein
MLVPGHGWTTRCVSSPPPRRKRGPGVCVRLRPCACCRHEVVGPASVAIRSTAERARLGQLPEWRTSKTAAVESIRPLDMGPGLTICDIRANGPHPCRGSEPPLFLEVGLGIAGQHVTQVGKLNLTSTTRPPGPAAYAEPTHQGFQPGGRFDPAHAQSRDTCGPRVQLRPCGVCRPARRQHSNTKLPVNSG